MLNAFPPKNVQWNEYTLWPIQVVYTNSDKLLLLNTVLLLLVVGNYIFIFGVSAIYGIHWEVTQSSSTFVINHVKCLQRKDIPWKKYTVTRSTNYKHSAQYLVISCLNIFSFIFFVFLWFSSIKKWYRLHPYIY